MGRVKVEELSWEGELLERVLLGRVWSLCFILIVMGVCGVLSEGWAWGQADLIRAIFYKGYLACVENWL